MYYRIWSAVWLYFVARVWVCEYECTLYHACFALSMVYGIIYIGDSTKVWQSRQLVKVSVQARMSGEDSEDID